MLNGPPLAGAPHARLHFVVDEQDAVFVAQLPQGREEAIGRDDIAAFPLDGFHDDARDLIGRHQFIQHLLFDIAHHGFAVIFAGFGNQHRAVGIGVRHVNYTGHPRVIIGAIAGLAGRERQRAHRAPVKGAQEGDEKLAFGIVLGHFERGLDAFRTGIGQENHAWLFKRSNIVEALGQAYPEFMVIVSRDVKKLLGLLLNCLDHFGMAVAGGVDGNAGNQIHIAVAVHVPHFRALAVGHHKISHSSDRGGNHLAVTRQNRFGLGARHVTQFHSSSPQHGIRGMRPTAHYSPSAEHCSPIISALRL